MLNLSPSLIYPLFLSFWLLSQMPGPALVSSLSHFHSRECRLWLAVPWTRLCRNQGSHSAVPQVPILVPGLSSPFCAWWITLNRASFRSWTCPRPWYTLQLVGLFWFLMFSSFRLCGSPDRPHFLPKPTLTMTTHYPGLKMRQPRTIGPRKLNK